MAVAVRWARRNLPRISLDIIDHAEALITGSQSWVQTQGPQELARKMTVATMTDPTDHQPEQQSDWHRLPPAADPPCDQRELQRGGRRTRGTVLTKDSILQEPEPEQLDEVRVLKAPTHIPMHSELLSSMSSRKRKREREPEPQPYRPRGKSLSRSIRGHTQMERYFFTLLTISHSQDNRGTRCINTPTPGGS